MWVKICGLTDLEDARSAVEAGADAVGFILVPSSPRVVTRRRIEEILMALPRTVLTVGVVADEDPNFLKDLLRVCPFGALQFHGEEAPEEVLRFKGRVKLIKAIRVRDTRSLEAIPGYQGVDAVLLDRSERVNTPTVRAEPFGSVRPELSRRTNVAQDRPVEARTPSVQGGPPFDWELAVRAKGFDIPVIVAGGLNPANVQQVIRQVDPYGVDVSSGVEHAPGRKDPSLVREFVLKAKQR